MDGPGNLRPILGDALAQAGPTLIEMRRLGRARMTGSEVPLGETMRFSPLAARIGGKGAEAWAVHAAAVARPE